MLNISKIAQVTVALALPSSILLIYWWYKHSSSDEEAYGKKRVVTSRSTVIEVTVPHKAVGAIIGKQGANIKNIQKQTGARLHFKDKDREGEIGSDGDANKANRTVVIHGTAESAQQAELMIHQIIAEIPKILTEVIEVPRSSIGRIIGKGGSNIRETTRITGAKIMIDRNENLKGPDVPRTVTLTGSRQQIDAALDLIEEQLEKEEQMRARLSVSAANRDHRDKGRTREHKEHVKIKAVPIDEDVWEDTPTSGSITQQDNLPQKADYIEVFVSAVEHPHHFWVQQVGAKALQLEQIQNDITTFVSSLDAKQNYAVTEATPGLLVAAKFEETEAIYYRAKILGETEDGKVDLYFVDFGDNAFVEKKDIFKLRSDFTSFPFQAIECQLANVEPVGGSWSEDGITCFEELSHCAEWKSVFSRVISYTQLADSQTMPVVQLIDTSSGSQDIDLGAELVKRGYAVPKEPTNKNHQKAAGTNQISKNSQPANEKEDSSEAQASASIPGMMNGNGHS